MTEDSQAGKDDDNEELNRSVTSNSAVETGDSAGPSSAAVASTADGDGAPAEPTPERDEEELGDYESGGKKKKQKVARQYNMRSDLQEMMFGFGDVWPPKSSSVSLLEAITTNYIEDLTTRAVQVSELRGKLDKECFLYVVRKERRLFNRAARLLKSHEEIKSAQRETLREDPST
jgi:hypothetical protein